ncbi:MAG: UbiD family decarboxylase [Desulfuromonadales bacterium]
MNIIVTGLAGRLKQSMNMKKENADISPECDMPIHNLRQFISRLETAGELSRVTVPVDPVMEIAAITDRVCKQPDGGKALLFEHPTGSHFQVATNLFGSATRVCQALGVVSINELTDRLRGLIDSIPVPDSRTLDRQITALAEFSRFAPRTNVDPDHALIQMDPPNLSSFPFLKSWPEDGAASGYSRYITLPQVFTADPDGGTHNCGMYRVQLRGDSDVAIQWKVGSGAARHAELYRLAGKPMPVAIALGGDPATLFSAMFPLPGDLDELTFAGFLRGTALVTSPCQSVPLLVPTGAEMIIEGYIDPGDTVTEGQFGNHSGLYSPAAPASLMRVTAVSHRPDAIIPATVVGPPPMEDCWMALAWERLLLAFLLKLVPSVKDIHFPFEWVFHQSAVIVINNPQPGTVKAVAGQLWALPWFSSARILLFVAAKAGIHGLPQAAWKSINVTDASQDVYRDGISGRIAIDATDCRLQRPEVKSSAACAELVTRRWKEYGFA